MTINRAERKSGYDTPGIRPYIAVFAAVEGAAQTVRASRDAPNCRNSCASVVSWVINPLEPPYENGRTASAPCASRISVMRAAI